METAGSFLFALILAGLFSALVRLVLPERFSSLGRLIKVLTAALMTLILLSPVLKLLSDGKSAINEWSARFLPADSGTAQGRELEPEELIEREAARRIEAGVYAIINLAAPGSDCRVRFEKTAAGINGSVIVIEYGKEDFPAEEVAAQVRAAYALECRCVRETPKEAP